QIANYSRRVCDRCDPQPLDLIARTGVDSGQSDSLRSGILVDGQVGNRGQTGRMVYRENGQENIRNGSSAVSIAHRQREQSGPGLVGQSRCGEGSAIAAA